MNVAHLKGARRTIARSLALGDNVLKLGPQVQATEGVDRGDNVVMTDVPLSREAPALGEVAFYYPGHLWREGDWVKTLLLFFDGVGLLVSEYKLHEPELLDPISLNH